MATGSRVAQEDLEKNRPDTKGKRIPKSKAEIAELKRHSRKQLVKRLRDEGTLKSQLRNDLANFLIDINLDTVDDFESEMRMFLRDGSYGYQRMRSKDLIDAFSDMYRQLYDQGREMRFFSSINKEDSYYPRRNRLDETQSIEVRRDYAQAAEELMCRLFEEAIKL